MKIKTSFLICFLALMVVSFTIFNNHSSNLGSINESSIDYKSNKFSNNKASILTSYDDTESPLITNIVRNGGFESATSYGNPNYWGVWGSSTIEVNKSYTDLTHGGSYAGNIKVKGTESFSGSINITENGVIVGAVGIIGTYVGLKTITWFFRRKKA